MGGLPGKLSGSCWHLAAGRGWRRVWWGGGFLFDGSFAQVRVDGSLTLTLGFGILRRPTSYIPVVVSRRERGLSGAGGWHGIYPDTAVPPLPSGEGWGEGALPATNLFHKSC
ncbi:hypothetical protein D3C81_1633680 [compost metagenome]